MSLAESSLETTTPRTEVLARLALLPMVADHGSCITIERIMSISLTRVLWHVWHPGRETRSIARLKQGERPPPIDVSRFRHRREVWYVPNDGNHRAAAAAAMGRARIRAHVTSETLFDFSSFVVFRGRLWRRLAEGRLQQVGVLDPDLQRWALLFGAGALP